MLQCLFLKSPSQNLWSLVQHLIPQDLLRLLQDRAEDDKARDGPWKGKEFFGVECSLVEAVGAGELLSQALEKDLDLLWSVCDLCMALLLGHAMVKVSLSCLVTLLNGNSCFPPPPHYLNSAGGPQGGEK